MPLQGTLDPIDQSPAALRFRFEPANDWLEDGQVAVLSPWGIVEHDEPVDVTVGFGGDLSTVDERDDWFATSFWAIRAVINFACAWKYPLEVAMVMPSAAIPEIPQAEAEVAINDHFSDLPDGVTLTIHQ